MRGRVFYILQGGLAGFFFGTSAIFIRYLPYMDSFMIGFYRLVIASLILTFFGIFFLREDLLKAFKMGGFRLIVLGFVIGLHFVTYIDSVKNTTVMNATVITNTTPIFAIIFSVIFYKHIPSLKSIMGIISSTIGIIIIFSTSLTFTSNILGDFEALLAAIFWAVYLIYGKSLRSIANPFATMILVYVSSSLLLYVFGFLFGSPRLFTLSELPPILGLAILPTTLGHTLSFSSLKGLQPYQTAILSLLEPIVSTILAIPLFGEVPTAVAVIGSILVFAGIYLTVSSEK
ncbi:MAG: DMT family transporter [Nitrososphaerota archaeon]|nr:DMT family transporter [Candidatus Geocrenenecus dongiae]